MAKTIQGSLTLHGVTRPVSIDVKGQMKNGQVIVVGSTTISFADYNIAQPRSTYVVSLDNHGILEFQLIFTKVSGAAAAANQPFATPTGCRGGFQSAPSGGQPSFPPGGAPPSGGGNPPINTPAPVPSPVN